MALSQDLIVTARRLTRANARRPRQADLKRAVSKVYYAVFHALAHECADRFIGTGRSRSQAAWHQVYRALDHGFAKDAGRKAAKLGFSREIANFADIFWELQELRHQAGYDPSTRFSRAEAVLAVTSAELATAELGRADLRDRAAFAALVLLKRR